MRSYWRILFSIELVELNRYTCDIYLGDAGANVFSAGEGDVNTSQQSTPARAHSPVSFPVLRSGDRMTTKTNSERRSPLANTGAGVGSITAIAQFAQSNQALYAQITALRQFNEEIVTKNIADCALFVWADGRFDYETETLPQSLAQTPCGLSFRQYGLHCAKSRFPHRALRCQMRRHPKPVGLTKRDVQCLKTLVVSS